MCLVQTLYYCIQCQTPQPGMCQHCKWEHDRSHCLLQVRPAARQQHPNFPQTLHPPEQCQRESRPPSQADVVHMLSVWTVQVRRYVYQDVVRLADIAPYFCPSQIQAYVINGAEVVFLRPRPSSKVPDRQDEKIEPCRACGRHCRAPTTFCSLTCKVGLVTSSLEAGPAW